MRTFTEFIESYVKLSPDEPVPPYQTGLRPGYEQMTWDTRMMTPKIDDETMMKIVGMSIVKGMNAASISQELGGIYSRKQINRNLLRYGLTKEVRREMVQAAAQRVGMPSQGGSRIPWDTWQDEDIDEPRQRPVTPQHSNSLYNKFLPLLRQSETDPKHHQQLASLLRDFAEKFGVSATSEVGQQIARYYGGPQSGRLGIQKALSDQTVNVAEIVKRAQEDVQK